MTSPANSAAVALWRRRLAVLLVLAVALVTVRGLMCTDGMPTHMPSVSASASMPTSIEPSEPAAWSPSPASGGASDGAATTSPWWCPALTTATGTTDPASCLQPSASAAANLTGAAAPAADRSVWHALAPPAVRQRLVAAVLHHAATLHQLGLLRT